MNAPRARNLILTGGIQHDFAPAAGALAHCLEAASVESAITLDIDTAWPRIAAGEFELVTIYALRWRMTQNEKYAPHRRRWAYEIPDGGRAALISHVRRGGGLLGLHTAALCFDTWQEWPALLGAAWQWGTSHHPALAPMHVGVTATSHPITAGCAGFDTVDETYHALDVRTTAPALLESMRQPLLWAHEVQSGRVVYDALGHDAVAIANAGHARVLRRAAAWLLKRPDDVTVAL